MPLWKLINSQKQAAREKKGTRELQNSKNKNNKMTLESP